MPRMQVHRDRVLLLRRELRRDDPFRTAQHEGADASLQKLQPLGVLLLLDRPPIEIGEALFATQQARRGERGQRPQLAEIVLHGRAGDHKYEGRAERAGCPVPERCGVLDLLRLVEDQSRPGEFAILLRLSAEERVAGDDDVCSVHGIRQTLTATRAHRSNRHHVQGRSEPFAFDRPVADDTGGCDDEEGRGIRSLLVRTQHHRDRLQGLSQPHVIGEDAAQTVPAEEVEPRVAGLLVWTKLRLQPDRRRDRLDTRVGRQRSHREPPLGFRRGDDAELAQFGPQINLILADAQAIHRSIGEGFRLFDDGAQRSELLPVQREVGTARQHEHRVADAERREQRGELDLLTAERDRDAQVVPVPVALRVDPDDRKVS